MTQEQYIKISECARRSGVSVRTLHYYEEIGLLVPGRTSNGYRVYSKTDVLHLQQILIQRSFGLSLRQIKKALEKENFDYLGSLRTQRQSLQFSIEQARDKIEAIDQAIRLIEEKDFDMTKIFKGFDPKQYEEEAEEKWGQSQRYNQSRLRTEKYRKDDWAKMQKELDEIWRDAAQAMLAGERPDSEIGMTLAERHRQHICHWFYDCSPDMHKGLSKMWLADERFKQSIDAHGVGLTEWIAAAVQA